MVSREAYIHSGPPESSTWTIHSVAPRWPSQQNQTMQGTWDIRCIMTVLFRNAYLFPFSPPANNRLPILAAIPIPNVCTGHDIYCIVSYIARPALTLPPGELMYSLIGRVASSASRKRSWAVRSVEGRSETGPRKMTRSRRRRE